MIYTCGVVVLTRYVGTHDGIAITSFCYQNERREDQVKYSFSSNLYACIFFIEELSCLRNRIMQILRYLMSEQDSLMPESNHRKATTLEIRLCENVQSRMLCRKHQSFWISICISFCEHRNTLPDYFLRNNKSIERSFGNLNREGNCL